MVWGIPSRLGPCVSTQDIVRSPFGPSAIGKFLNFRVPAYLAGGLSYSAGLIGNHAMHSVESQSSQKSAKVILAGQEQIEQAQPVKGGAFALPNQQESHDPTLSSGN